MPGERKSCSPELPIYRGAFWGGVNVERGFLWITREKLWINPLNWGEPVIFSKNHQEPYSYIWGVFLDTPYISKNH